MIHLLYSRPAACAALLAGVVGNATAAPFLPDFSAASFVDGTAVDNSYFPLLDTATRIYIGSGMSEGEPIEESFELTVIGAGPTILGVQTTTQRDRAYEEDLLVEDTFDYYAQDSAGNVWYFGEDVVNYLYDDEDNLIGTNTESSWRAGENSALPGFIMPASVAPGFHYYQEFGPFDAALDEGMTLAHDRELSIPVGDFSAVLAVLETSALNPQERGIKYYAPGFGLIGEDEGLNLDLQDPTIHIELSAISAVPLPAPLLLLGSALAGVLAGVRRNPV